MLQCLLHMALLMDKSLTCYQQFDNSPILEKGYINHVQNYLSFYLLIISQLLFDIYQQSFDFCLAFKSISEILKCNLCLTCESQLLSILGYYHPTWCDFLSIVQGHNVTDGKGSKSAYAVCIVRDFSPLFRSSIELKKIISSTSLNFFTVKKTSVEKLT